MQPFLETAEELELKLPGVPRSSRTPPPIVHIVRPMDRSSRIDRPHESNPTNRPVGRNVGTLPCVNTQAQVAGVVSCLTLAHARAYL